MERARGDTLESKWGCLSDNQKASIRDQPDSIVSDFRSISPPPTEEPSAVFRGGNLRRGCGIMPRALLAMRLDSNGLIPCLKYTRGWDALQSDHGFPTWQ